MVAEAQALIDWKRLYQWTQQQEPGEVLGQSCTNNACPLARYLNEKTGIRWSVGPSIRPADGTVNDRLDKPEWVKHLLLQTDDVTGHKSGPVTRELYLGILDDLKEEAEEYIPTVEEEALYLTLLTSSVLLKIMEEDFGDLEIYNRLTTIAREADTQARRLHHLLEQSSS